MLSTWSTTKSFKIYQSDVDMFGLQNPPSVPSILITVLADSGHNTATRIKYSVPWPLKGIKPENKKINVICSLHSNDGN